MTLRKSWAAGLLSFLSVTAAAQSWQPQGAGFSAAGVSIADIAAPSPTAAWAIATVLHPSNFGGVAVPVAAHTITGGTAWAAGTIPMPADHSPSSIAATDSNTAWVCSYSLSTLAGGNVYHTTDGGVSWTDQSPAGFNDAARYVHFFDANEGVLVGDSSVYLTTNGGAGWAYHTTLPVPFGGEAAGFLFNASEVKGDYIWLGDVYGYYYKSKDRGHTWTRLQGNVYPNSIKGIAFRDSLFGLSIASHFSGGGNGGGADVDDGILHRTTDGGTTWTDLPFTLPGSNIANYYAKYDIAYIPGTANTFILTAETNGGFSAITQDGGDTWQLIDSNVQHTACVFTGAANGWSGGYTADLANGIFRWSAAPAGIPGLPVASLKCFPNPAKEFINLQLPAGTATGVLTITDAAGRPVYQNTQWLPAGAITLHGLAAGSYQLQFTTGQAAYIGRFLKQ